MSELIQQALGNLMVEYDDMEISPTRSDLILSALSAEPIAQFPDFVDAVRCLVEDYETQKDSVYPSINISKLKAAMRRCVMSYLAAQGHPADERKTVEIAEMISDQAVRETERMRAI
jgi:hypothetical protein